MSSVFGKPVCPQLPERLQQQVMLCLGAALEKMTPAMARTCLKLVSARQKRWKGDIGCGNPFSLGCAYFRPQESSFLSSPLPGRGQESLV